MRTWNGVAIDLMTIANDAHWALNHHQPVTAMTTTDVPRKAKEFRSTRMLRKYHLENNVQTWTWRR